jgi:hypothetical protein
MRVGDESHEVTRPTAPPLTETDQRRPVLALVRSGCRGDEEGCTVIGFRFREPDAFLDRAGHRVNCIRLYTRTMGKQAPHPLLSTRDHWRISPRQHKEEQMSPAPLE